MRIFGVRYSAGMMRCTNELRILLWRQKDWSRGETAAKCLPSYILLNFSSFVISWEWYLYIFWLSLYFLMLILWIWRYSYATLLGVAFQHFGLGFIVRNDGNNVFYDDVHSFGCELLWIIWWEDFKVGLFLFYMLVVLI